VIYNWLLLLLIDAARLQEHVFQRVITNFRLLFLMSRRNNKIATQAETADRVSALSEAASSSSSSAPIHATRGASAALLAKEIVQDAY
jgi:hypothetical protein